MHGYFTDKDDNLRIERFADNLPQRERAVFASVGVNAAMRRHAERLSLELAEIVRSVEENGHDLASFVSHGHVERVRRLLTWIVEQPWIPELAGTRDELSRRLREDDLTLADLPFLMRAAASYIDPNSYDLADGFSERRDQLLPIMDDILTRRHIDARRKRGERLESWQHGIDDETFKQDVLKHAKTYVDNAWMHAPALTNLIAVSVLDAELLPLRRTASDPVGMLMGTGDPSVTRLARFMEMPDEFDRIRIWVRRITEAAGALLALALLGGGVPILGLALGAYIGWRVYVRRKARIGYHMLRNEAVSKLRSILAEMQEIRDEIESAAYSPERIKERLRELEGRGGYVASILYDVIGCGAGHRPESAIS